MTREEAIANLKMISVAFVDPVTKEQRKLIDDTFDMAIQALEQMPTITSIGGGVIYYPQVEGITPTVIKPEPCDDAVSRQAVLDMMQMRMGAKELYLAVHDMPSVKPQEQTGHCKDCKYFEYDSVAKVDGIPLIVAHEICNKWGDGCKTKEDGYCFMFEEKQDMRGDAE